MRRALIVLWLAVFAIPAWSQEPGKGPRIVEPRLEQKVSKQFRGAAIALHAPPAPIDSFDTNSGVTAYLFPEWFLTAKTVASSDGRGRARRLIPVRNLERGHPRRRANRAEPDRLGWPAGRRHRSPRRQAAHARDR